MLPYEIVGYIDPGSGTIILQVVMSGLLAIGFFLRNRIFCLFRLFSKKTNQNGEQTSDVEANEKKEMEAQEDATQCTKVKKQTQTQV